MIKLAALIGEEMLQFRHGSELYSYCGDCKMSDVTPITGLLGCTIGDKQEIIDYSESVAADQVNPEEFKCPGFESRTSAQTGVGGPREASYLNDAVLVKHIPSEIELIDSDDGLFDDLEKEAATPAAEGQDQRAAFFDYLKSLNLPMANESIAKQGISSALISWQDGLMAGSITDELVNALYIDLKTES